MALEKKPYAFGCNEGEVDHRDHIFSCSLGEPSPDVTVLSPVDLRSKSGPVRNQGGIGACTAFGITEMFDFVRRKHNLTSWTPSPLFTYYASRKITNDTDKDCGSTLRNALKSTVNSGVAMERVWPYDPSRFTENPPQEVWDNAEKHQTLEYLKIDRDKNQFVGCLNEGYPFAFGLRLFTSFMTVGMFRDGIVPIPDKTTEGFMGGHCMLAVGYRVDDDGKEYIIAQNSWGKYWGDRGYCYIPMEYFNSIDCFDMWTIRLTEVCDSDEADPEPTPEPEPTPQPEPTPEPEPTPAPPEPEPVPEPAPVPVPTPPEPAPVVPPAPEPVVPDSQFVVFLKNILAIFNMPITYFIILIISVLISFILMK